MESDGQNQHDLYAVLGLERNAQDSDIDEAYEARLDACEDLSREPELDGLTQEDVKRIRSLLILAYKTLRNPIKRSSYDRQHFQDHQETNIQEHNELDLSYPNHAESDQQQSESSAFVLHPIVASESIDSIEQPEPNDTESQKTSEQQGRTRRFTEFPSFPNMMAAQEAAQSAVPQGRLKKTTSLPIQALENLAEVARREMEQQPEDVNSIEMDRQHLKSKTHSEPAGHAAKPASVQKVAAKIVDRLSSSDQALVLASQTARPKRPSLEMPHSYVNNIKQMSDSKSKFDYFLIFCAFVLPLGTLIFVVTHFLTQ